MNKVIIFINKNKNYMIIFIYDSYLFLLNQLFYTFAHLKRRFLLKKKYIKYKFFILFND